MDSCDCILVARALHLLRPKVIIMEINWSFPPPLRFARHCHRDWIGKYSQWKLGGFSFSTFGCSLSAAVAELSLFGFSLWRLVGQTAGNAIFVHRDVADVLGGAEVRRKAQGLGFGRWMRSSASTWPGGIPK